MHMGDLLFNRAHPNIDRAQGARIDNWIAILDTVAKRGSNDTIFIAGHAKDNQVRNTRAELTHFRNYLTAVLDHVRAGVKAGQSKEEIQKLPALKGFEDNVSPNARLTHGVRARHCLRRSDEREAVAGRSGQQASRHQGTGIRNVMNDGSLSRQLSPSRLRPLRFSAQAPPPPTPVFTEKSAGNGPLDRLWFRPIGPATPSGRVDDLAVLESDPTTFYVAMATAGVYKTTNAGTTFTSVFDNEGSGSVGAIAIAATDANLVWVGTGEGNNRQSSSWGDGIYKSTDGGRSWKNMGLKNSKQIAKIIVDPIDFNVVYVAALGDLWGRGGERGVYKTTDGGVTWNRVLHVDDDTGATELVMDPLEQQDALHRDLPAAAAAVGHERRRCRAATSGRPPTAASTWTKLESGIPSGPKGRIGLDVYRRNPNVLYARIEHETESGVYRSDNAGATWQKLSTTNPRPMYFGVIKIDPQTDSRIYVPGVSLHISDDGGRTFRADGAERIHVDHHALWINPRDPRHLIIGNDGGVAISHDRSQTWVWMPNLLGAQAYHVEFDMQTPYHVCAGLQDNNTWCGPSAVRTNSGVNNDDWYVISGGDGFQPLMDPTDARIVYAESQDGRMSRTDRFTNERTTVRPEPAEQKPGDTTASYRFNWDTAMQLSPFDPATIYIGANLVLKSSDRGRSYQPISPDLDDQHRSRSALDHGRRWQGHPLAKNDGVGSFGNIVTLEESAARQGVVWVGSDDGVVSVTQDSGKTWTNVTSKISGVPKWTYVADVLPSRAQAGTAYVAFDGHRGGDYKTYVFTTDRLRRHVAIDCEQPAAGRSRARPRRGSQGSEHPVSRHRNRPVGQLEQGRAVDAAQGQPADDADLRDQAASARQRSDPREPRARHLDPRRPDADPGVGEVRERGRVPVQQRAGDDHEPGERSDEGLRRRSPVPRPESGAGRDDRVSAEGRCEGREDHDQGRERSDGSRVDGARDSARDAIARSQQGRPQHREVGSARAAAASAAAASGSARRRRSGRRWRRRWFGGGGNNGPYVLPGTYKATLNVNGRDAQTIDRDREGRS